jgi:exodeoxyribonuclease X
MTETQAAVIDTETTGLDQPQVIEFASAPVTAADGPTFSMGAATVQRFKPTKPISLGAMATHHIVPADLEDCPAPPTSYELPRFIIGHNIDFDWQAMGSPDVKRIDTLALAREAWPGLDSYSLGALTYHLHSAHVARDLLKNAHSAETDILLCFSVFEAALRTIKTETPLATWDDIWRVAEAARVPKVMTFGKHQGKPIKDVPRDYADWYRRQIGPDPYLIQAFKNAGLIPA